MAIDILKLSNELIYRAYTMNRNQVRKHMDELNFRDYIALQRISQLALSDGVYSGRAYLKDISDNMKLSMRQTSKMAEELKNRGLVTWSHDGDGSDGTYLFITDLGKELVTKNEEILRKYYGKIIEKYGKEDMIRLLQMMKRLKTVMQHEFEEMEGEEKDEEFSE